MSYIEEIDLIISKYINEYKYSEEELINACKNLYFKNKDNKEYLYDLNDSIRHFGYLFNFEVKDNKESITTIDEYRSLIHNVKKSKEKTKLLVDFLNKYKDKNYIFASLYLLKVEHLVSLNLLNESYNEKHKNESLMELIYNYIYFYDGNETKLNELKQVLYDIGLVDAFNKFGMFYICMECLLYTITKKCNIAYKYINTIKIAFNILPLNFYEDNKNYYSETMAKDIFKYLNQVDKKYKDIIVKTFLGFYNFIDGYFILFNYFSA